MNTLRRTLLLMLVSCFSLGSGAREYSGMYTPAELQRANTVYSENIRGSLYEDIGGYLSADETRTLQQVRLWQPWNSVADPFEFSANPDTGVIKVPTFSVKFFDELAIATAWFERFSCNKEAVFDYVAALDFSDRELTSPLKALAVPNDAYKLDDFVDDVSQKTLKSALAFLMLHELGHVHHQHRSYREVSPAEAQAQEAEADRFAMRVLRRMRLPPMGMTVWFMAVSMRDPLIEDSPRQTHPLTSSRLRAIARDLRDSPEDFIEPANRGTLTAAHIRSIADDIDTIAQNLADPQLRSFVRERGRLATPQLLTSACEVEQHSQDWLQRFEDLVQ